MTEKKYRGTTGTPIEYPKRASAQQQRQTDSQQYDNYVDDNPNAWTEKKIRTSALRLDYPRRTTNLPDPKKTRVMQERRLDRYTLIIIVNLIIIIMVGGWLAFNVLAYWWTNWQDDLHYGNPRTSQVDQFVGQGDSPTLPDHFIVVNINGRVVVVQLNLAHPELDHTYSITTTDPKTPVSLNFRQTGNTLAMYANRRHQRANH